MDVIYLCGWHLCQQYIPQPSRICTFHLGSSLVYNKKIIATSYLRYLQKIRQWTLYQVDPITWKNRTLRQSPNGAERMWRQDVSTPAVIRTNKQLLEWRNMDDDPLISSSNISKARILTENDSVPGLKFKQDLENYMVSQLKRWLKCWGLRLSGKRTDLVARIRDCLKSANFYVLDSSTDNGKWLEAKILKEKKVDQRHYNDLAVPVIPKTGWRAFPSQDIPSLFNYGHVYHYALESLPFVEDNTADEDNNKILDTGVGHMTDKPCTVGRKYVDSGFVHDLNDNKTDEHYFVRAHVWPSMQGDLPHNVNVVLSGKSFIYLFYLFTRFADRQGHRNSFTPITAGPVTHPSHPRGGNPNKWITAPKWSSYPCFLFFM